MTSDKKPARIIATDETLLGICEELIFDGVVDLNHVDVSNVTKFSNAFSNLQRRSYVRRLAALQYSTSCYEVTQPPARDEVSSRYRLNVDISEWDVSNGKFFVEMFRDTEFHGDISRWNVGNALSVWAMFANCDFVTNLSRWRFLKEVKSNLMFDGASSDELPHLDFKSMGLGENLDVLGLSDSQQQEREARRLKLLMDDDIKSSVRRGMSVL